MFASNKGDQVVPVDSTADFGPVYWVASKTGPKTYVKLANYGEDQQTVQLRISGTKTGKLEMLSTGQHQGNTPFNVQAQTVTTTVFNPSGNYAVNMDPWAVAVLAVS
jgi:alpha-N-arabinofuranosidase